MINMKRTAALLAALTVTVSAVPAGLVYGAEAQPAIAQLIAGQPDPAYTCILNGEEIVLPIVQIGDELYTAVRAFAGVMGYHAELQAAEGLVEILDGLAGTEAVDLAAILAAITESGPAVRSTNKLAYNGRSFEVPIYEVSGYSFVTFDVAAQFFGYGATIRAEEGVVSISDDPLADIGDEDRQRYADYVKEYGIPLDLATASKLENTDFEQYDIFFVGESHATKRNYDLQLYFIKYFNEHYGIRHIIRETGYAEAMWENQFLATGDVTIAERSLEGARGSSAYNKESYDFLVDLYEYNKKLPEDKKLILLGVDVQHNRASGYAYLRQLLDREGAPAYAQDHLARLNDLTDEADVPALFAEILATAEYADFLGADYQHLVLSIQSIAQSREYYQLADFEVREQFIRQNFADLHGAYGFEKAFGMLGGAHVNLTSYFGATPNLAQFVNDEHAATKGKLCTIIADYNNCFYMDQYTGASLPVPDNYSKTVSDIMAAAFASEAILYPLEKADSIFVEHGFSPAFSYFLSVKNSPAVTPYGDLQ